MAKSHGQSVGGVGGLGNFLHGEQRANENLDLALIGMAVTSDGGFDFARSVAEDFDLMLRGSEENDAANFGEAKGGFDVQSREDRFDGDGVRRKFTNEIAEKRVNSLESRACGDLALFRNAECAVVKDAARSAVGFDNAIAGGACGGRIDTQNSRRRDCGIHRTQVYGEAEWCDKYFMERFAAREKPERASRQDDAG